MCSLLLNPHKMSITQQSEPSLRTLGLAEDFHMKVPVYPSHHEAKPRRETRIGQGASHDSSRDISAILKIKIYRRELQLSFVINTLL